MKIRFMFVMVASMLVNGALAHARSPMPAAWTTELTRFELDENTPGRDLVVSASLRVDYAKREARLLMVRRMHCPPGHLCSQMIPAPIIVDLPIVNISTDDCGSRVIKAGRDLRMTDGALEQLSIRDNSRNHCPTFVALPGTEVVYRVEGVRPRTSMRSTFSGDRLRPDYSAE